MGRVEGGCVNGSSFDPSQNKALPPELEPRVQYEIRSGDILMSRANTKELLGSAAIVKDVRPRLLLCDKLYRLIVSEHIDREYAVFAMRTHLARFQYERAATGASGSMQNIGQDTIKDLLIALPPVPEQRLIVNFLDRETARIDALIGKKRRLLELLEEKRLAVITHAVAKGLDPDAPMKDSGIDWLGRIPVHWEIKQARFVIGKGVYGISDSTSDTGEYGVLRMGDIGYGEVSSSNLARIDTVDPELLVEPGDLLFNRTNSYEQVAKVGLFRGDPDQQVTYASYLVRFRPSDHSEYLRFLLNIPLFLEFVRSHSFRAIGQVNINPSRYAQLKICVPPGDEQKAIADHLLVEERQIASVATKIRDAIRMMQEYRSALITNAVTGKIDVCGEAAKEAAA